MSRVFLVVLLTLGLLLVPFTVEILSSPIPGVQPQGFQPSMLLSGVLSNPNADD